MAGSKKSKKRGPGARRTAAAADWQGLVDTLLAKGGRVVIEINPSRLGAEPWPPTIHMLTHGTAAPGVGAWDTAAMPLASSREFLPHLRARSPSRDLPDSPTRRADVAGSAQSALPQVRMADPAALKHIDLAISPAMDPRLQVACARRRIGAPSRSLASATPEEVAVVAKVADVDALESLSEVRVVARLGAAQDGNELVTARIPVSRVEQVRSKPFVVSMKASQPLRRSLQATTTEMSTRPQDLPANVAPDGGAGVIVGIVDFGCDFAHENFRRADGTTRLLGIWNQAGASAAGSPFGYGRLFAPAEINAALKKSDPYTTLGYGPRVTAAGGGAHGTHVMDIAAGNGRGTGVPGNAPKADLLFVEVAASDITWSGPDSTRQSFGDSVQLLEAVKFIFDQAADRPCVVNVSLGTNGGPHDGTTLVEQGLDSLVREKPNRAVVIAASNSFADHIHATGTVPANGTTDLAWQTPVGQLEREVEIWLPANTQVACEIVAPDGTSLGIAEPGSNLGLSDDGQLAIFVSNRLREPNNGDNTISIFVAGGVPGGRWVARLHSRNGVDAAFHAWIERQDDEQSSFDGTPDDSHTIGSISCGHESIAVGSYDAHKAARPISFFSAAGPTRDGRRKPEVSAPGHAVVAAASRSKTGVTNKSGTSMAAPAVTGLIALLLSEAQRRGAKLSSAQIRAAVMDTARQDPPSNLVGGWDQRYGVGRVNSTALNQIGGVAPPIAALATPKAKAKKRAAAKPVRGKRRKVIG
jgi:subtilisin family serine protease